MPIDKRNIGYPKLESSSVGDGNFTSPSTSGSAPSAAAASSGGSGTGGGIPPSASAGSNITSGTIPVVLVSCSVSVRQWTALM